MAKAKYDYFDAFYQQASIAVKEADLLLRVIREFETNQDLKAMMEEAHQLEHEGDEINHQTFNAVALDFITPFEREDIIGLTQSMDNVIDSIEDVIQFFYMFDIRRMHPAAEDLAETIKKSCVALQEAAAEFKNFKKPDRLQQLIIAVNDLEEQGDAQYLECMHNMFSAETPDPIKSIIWSKIFARLELATDACEHASDVMGTVILKNS